MSVKQKTGGGGNRKKYRNRIGKSQANLTHYRKRHGIPAGTRADNHSKGLCPLHRKK